MPEHSTESDMSLSDAVTWAHGWDRSEAAQQPEANHSAQHPDHHRHHHRDVLSQPRTPLPPSRKRKRTNTQGSSDTDAEARQPPQPITEAPIVPDFPPYEPGSRRGERRLRFIRHALSLPPDVSFAAIDAFLARNTSVLRHLAACTAPHPDWRLEDDDESRSNNDEQGGGGRSRRWGEVRVCDAEALRRNEMLYRAISELCWQAKAVDDVLAWVEGRTGFSKEEDYAISVGLRKRRRERLHVLRCASVLEEDSYRFNEKDRRELAKAIRQDRPGSLLRHSVCSDDLADEDENEEEEEEGEEEEDDDVGDWLWAKSL
ncbi:hypothetical protein VFPBJ_04510 [Purpureocillium lilacinum]|uniref:Uncharacterized protein n=1 Tax=Purpureocillium lilacinum TaxID=33203 RepID=A0A179GVF1_PURLI|nr:hypothetical protein VFPBJ_04510 [Purpureocillium lilacinum]